MDTQKYHSMAESYMKMYENAGTKHPVVHPHRPMRPVVINQTKTNVSVDVTEPYVGPGGVEKAYYTFPAGFDPTNREDVMSSSKGTKSEDVSDIELVGDYLLEAGIVNSAHDVDAFYTHMSDEWKTHMIESLKQARKNVGADSCWDGYKATGTKMKGGKSVPDCKKEETIKKYKAPGVPGPLVDQDPMNRHYLRKPENKKNITQNYQKEERKPNPYLQKQLDTMRKQLKVSNTPRKKPENVSPKPLGDKKVPGMFDHSKKND